MKRIIAIFLLFFITLSCFSEGDKDKTKTYIEEWKETLLYGISDQVLDVIKQIKDADETRLNPELEKVLAETVSDKVKTEILAYFTDLEYTPAADTALTFIKNFDEIDPDMVTGSIRYLAAIKNPDLKGLLASLIDYDDDKIRLQAITAAGVLEDSGIEDFLLEKLSDDEFPDKFKAEIILSLGKLGTGKSVEKLIEVLENTDNDHTQRINACMSLGELGDARAVPVLKAQLSVNDALLKAYAISALGNFNLSETITYLIEGLKDNNWKVRLQSARGLARKGNVKALDILIYKSKKDPENVIKLEALKSIGEIQDKKGFDYLREVYASNDQPIDSREMSLYYLLKYDLAASLSVIDRVVTKEWNNKRMPALEMTAKNLSKHESQLLQGIYKRFLDCGNYLIRIYGIRGIGKNKMTGFKEELKKLADEDPVGAVKKEAANVLGIL
ncbi:MAG: HEAT repeat domain-containing protein [Spirochaetales bacterium]|nr:HEAT repeat domain-containing protein [Spirochaetales bacterium]